MQTLIEKSQKLTALLIEYREAKIYENCLYHVVQQKDRQNMFFLIDIKNEQIKRDGTPKKIKAFLRIRNINLENVYLYSLLK